MAERQRLSGWGAKVIANLSKDIMSTLPGAKGFSVRNLKYMVKFAEIYTASEITDPIVQALPAQIKIKSPITPGLPSQLSKTPENVESEAERIEGHSIVQALPAQLDGDDIRAIFLNSNIAKIGWTHHITLMDKVTDPVAKNYYMTRTIKEGWSYRVLAHKIEEGLYESQGSLSNNFDTTLAPAQSALAKSIIKDQYMLGFLNIGDAVKERELEAALLKDIIKFLLELGSGFALMGQQYHLSVGGQDYYLDLLFYHTHLRCHFIIELKIDEFKPAYAGKLNFYVNAADDLIKTDQDQPTIGLLLCKSANKVIAEYSLQNMNKPIGVSTYNLLPKTEDLIQLLQSKKVEL